MNKEKKLWFKRKTYGWGWTPSTWQGWAVTAMYLFFVLIFILTIDEHSSMRDVWLTFIIPMVIITLLFIEIAYYKGETPKWQWGKKKDK